MDEILWSYVACAMDCPPYVCDPPRNPELIHLEDTQLSAVPFHLSLLETITNNFSENRETCQAGFGVVYKGVYGGVEVAVKKLSVMEFDDTSFHQEFQSLMKIRHQNIVPLLGYCSESITDASYVWRNLHRNIKQNCEHLHHFHKNTAHLDLKCSNIPLDEYLEPRIYDFDVSTPFDQNHIRDPEFVSQMDPIGVFDSQAILSFLRLLAMLAAAAKGVYSAVGGIAKAQIIKTNSSVWCALLKMLLFGKEIKLPVSRRSLNRKKTQYLKWNGTFRRCSFLFIPTEVPTEKKTVANGNGKGADNGSSVKVSFCQANHGLNASTEMPISQSERSSISRSDEAATVNNLSVTPSRTLESIWYIASAAAHHMTGVLDLLTNYTPMSDELDVHTPNMGRMQVLGSGSVNTANITLQDVWYVPGLDANLVSTNQLTKLGHTVSLGPYGCRINKDSEDGALIGSAHFTDDYLFAVDFLDAQPTN